MCIRDRLKNAYLHTAEGGAVGVELRDRTLTVTNDGTAPLDAEHIFERFYKEDSFTQGAGLGLSICQTIVDRLHGSISVSSELGKGTRFEVVIPDANE